MLKKIISRYFNSWYMPALIFLVFLGVFTGVVVLGKPELVRVADAAFLFAAAAFLGIIFAAIWNLIRKRWWKGIINVLLLPVCVFAVRCALASIIIASMFGPSEDGFADNLTIPEGIDISEPLAELEAVSGGEDAFQQALIAALKVPGGQDSAVTGNIQFLTQLHKQNSEMIRRYLASNPAWRVFEERGKVFATRRWMIGKEWKYDLHGYYTDSDIDRWHDSGISNFQSRFTIGLSGKPWGKGWKDTTWLNEGETVKAKLSTGNQMQESHCVISADSLVVEVFEQSGAPERRLTKAALAFLQKELKPLIDDPSMDTIRRVLPSGSIRKGEASLEIRNAFQPGIYDSIVWLNPGEPGMIYLKAFEVTKNIPLSVDRLKDKSNEWVGWSDDPEELFFSNTHFTIYEGDWGKPYATRLEVWFEPDSGGPERKLLDRIFKIEGWQR